MTGNIKISLTVNDQQIEAEVQPLTTLATFLRGQLRLKGTNVGCEEGVCGSCTVLLDGYSVRSCLTLAVQANGARVMTVEGYEMEPGLAPIQAALIKHFGAQCGFCTPGMMAVIAEYLADISIQNRADETIIRQRLSAVVCRCTGYQPLVRAVQELVKTKGGQHE